MHNRIEDGAVEAVDLFVDLFPLDAERFGVGDELVRQFIDGDDIRFCRLGDIVGDPPVEEIYATCAHLATSSQTGFGSDPAFCADRKSHLPVYGLRQGSFGSPNSDRKARPCDRLPKIGRVIMTTC